MADFTALQEMIEERRAGRERQTARREAIEKALMNGPNVERMKEWTLMMARDAFIESDHPRDEKGRFTEKGMTATEGAVSKGMTYGNIKETPPPGWRPRAGKSGRKEIWLSKAEYARVIHELNTNLTKEELAENFVVKHIGNYLYKAEVYDFGDYLIVGKEKIR